MKKFRIYQAEVFDEQKNFLSAKELDWQPTGMVFESYDEAYVKRCDLLMDSDHLYYQVTEEVY